jgi:SH3 domain-containing YSC84-like protein 1
MKIGVRAMTNSRYPLSRLLILLVAFPLAWGLTSTPSSAVAQEAEGSIVSSSTVVLQEIMETPINAIPKWLLADAQGVVIVPSLMKGGLIIGARYGKGVLVIRNEEGGWHLPVFVTLTGGNVGLQAGLQTTDVILILKTKKSVDAALNGKLTLGVDAGIAAGPLGRETGAATDPRFQSEIYSYSRSRGLFAGVSIDGSALQINQTSNAAYYPNAQPGEEIPIPQAASELMREIARYCDPDEETPPNEAVSPNPGATPNAGAASSLPLQSPSSQSEMLRQQLAQAAPELYELLDEPWRNYFDIPQEIFTGRGVPSSESLNETLDRFNRITQVSSYQELSQRPEFQSVHRILQSYASTLPAAEERLILPPPPTN